MSRNTWKFEFPVLLRREEEGWPSCVPVGLRGVLTSPGPWRRSGRSWTQEPPGRRSRRLLAAAAVCSALGTDHMGSTDRRQKKMDNAKPVVVAVVRDAA